jgi:hypothetical protein
MKDTPSEKGVTLLATRTFSGLVLVAVLFWCLRLQAYVFLTAPPTTWPDGNIPMDLQLSGPTSALIDGNTSWKAVAENALATWNPYVTTVRFTVYTQNQGPPASGEGIN